MHHLYRHWGKDDRLLYVGISLHAVARLIGHREKSEWFDSITKITIEQHETKESAERAEILAIKAERPIWNKTHVRVEDTVIKIQFPNKTYYLDESFVVTERKPRPGVLTVNDGLSKEARYKLANAEAIKAKDRERKAAKKAARLSVQNA